MILEAFSETLKREYQPGQSPEPILRDWLLAQLRLLPSYTQLAGFEHLFEETVMQHPLAARSDTDSSRPWPMPMAGLGCSPADPMAAQNDEDDHVASVIRREITAIRDPDSDRWLFIPNSSTGKALLKSLLEYCRSYDHWQFSKWLHQVQASDFHMNL
jgi:hypothetical protein